MYSQDIVSIITPAYNAVRFIPQTICSVLRQSYSAWEMLIVDDVSKDDTCSVVQDFVNKDSRIKLIRHEKNAGPAGARNTAIERAKGRYIAFLDSDDVWLPQKLEQQISFMQRENTPFCYTQYRRVTEQGDKEGCLIKVPKSLGYSDLLKNTAIVTSTVILDRIQTGDFRMVKTYYDDYVLWLDILKRGFMAVGLQQDLVRYRVVDRSVSRNKLRSALWVWRTYRHIEGLNRYMATWYLANYACRALRKYSKF